MTLAERMAKSDPFAIDQRLETAQRPSVRVEQDLSQRRHLWTMGCNFIKELALVEGDGAALML